MSDLRTVDQSSLKYLPYLAQTSLAFSILVLLAQQMVTAISKFRVVSNAVSRKFLILMEMSVINL